MEHAEAAATPEKPDFVFHGSPRGDIQEFVPRVSLGSGEAFGPQVYASDDLAVATMFTANVGGSWSTGKVGEILYAIIPLSREDFLARDKGGYIYKLPGQTFGSERGRGMGDREWASPVAVNPAEVNKVDSSLDAMIAAGVQVYFVDPVAYEEMLKTDEPSWVFLKDFESENFRRGANFKPLPHEGA